MSASEFSDRLRFALTQHRRRTTRRLTQSQLAHQLNVSQQAVAGWMVGRSMPRADVIFDLADTLGVHPRWLAVGTGDASPRVEAPTGSVEISAASDAVETLFAAFEESDLRHRITPAQFARAFEWMLDQETANPDVRAVLRVIG